MTPTEKEHESGIAVDLFKHADHKIEETRKEVANLKEVELTIKDMMKHLTNRVDFGVSKTAQENKDSLAKQAIVLNDTHHRIEGLDSKIDSVAKTLSGAISEIRDMVKNLYKYILVVFFTLVASGLIVVAFRVLGKFFNIQGGP